MSLGIEKPLVGLACAALVGGALATSCGRPLPPPKYQVYACGNVASADPHSHAFAAMYLALNELGWKLMERDFEKKKINAYACYATDPKRCANMRFQAMKSGVIFVNQMPRRPVPDNLRDDLERWMQAFNQTYGKFSCHTDDALRKAIEPFGFAF